jgi:hypothetical protein
MRRLGDWITMKLQQPRTRADDFDPRLHSHRYVYHWFAFFEGWLKGKKLKPHHLRDGAAFRELSVALDERGGRYEKLFFNGPATPESAKHYQAIVEDLVNQNEDPLIEDIVDYRVVDESFLMPGQVLVVATRLPMNDFQQENKVQVQPGFTSLEQKIIRVCRKYLVVCARSRVRLANAVARELPPKYANRADVFFKAYSEPWYTTLNATNPSARSRRAKSSGHRTAAYLLQLPEVPELNGADLLVMWGQGGTQTLAFAQLLRADLSHLLDHYGLSMVEMVAPEQRDTPWEDATESFLLHDAAEDWETKVLLDGVLLDPSGERVVAKRKVRLPGPAGTASCGGAGLAHPRASDPPPVHPEG